MINFEEMGYDRVFVSLDGTECQDNVFRRAMTVAAGNNSELYIGHVIDSTALETAGTYPLELIPTLEAGFRDSIADQVKRAEGIEQIKKVEVVVKAGRIRETLKEEMLDIIQPDIVICGARGLSSIKYALLGSISTYLIRSSKCDVLVVK